VASSNESWACGEVSPPGSSIGSELLWDLANWHDHEWLFGDRLDGVGAVSLVPQLARPQLAPYVLDSFLWRRSVNPRLPRLL
jgi:hypothetical protein